MSSAFASAIMVFSLVLLSGFVSILQMMVRETPARRASYDMVSMRL